jgi:hypothetical protein
MRVLATERSVTEFVPSLGREDWEDEREAGVVMLG